MGYITLNCNLTLSHVNVWKLKSLFDLGVESPVMLMNDDVCSTSGGIC